MSELLYNPPRFTITNMSRTRCEWVKDFLLKLQDASLQSAGSQDPM